MTELDTSFRDDLTLLADLQARIAELQEQADEIKAKLRANLTPDTYTVNGKRAVSIAETRRFSAAKASEVLPPQLLALCQVMEIDAARAKTVLPPHLYEQCQVVTGKPQVRLA